MENDVCVYGEDSTLMHYASDPWDVLTVKFGEKPLCDAFLSMYFRYGVWYHNDFVRRWLVGQTGEAETVYVDTVIGRIGSIDW